MIQITDKKDCCGCSSCVQKCPKQCISLKEDNEGFLYPVVDKESCIDCGLCEKVCPVLHQGEPHKPLQVYAAKNKDEEIRRQSSSGGIFTLLAEKVIHEGGVVFGARFDERWEVRHDYTETVEGLAAFRGSKYVQSKIDTTFKIVEKFLKEGRIVLFTGTPCQISGLDHFLLKEYDKLFKVEVACHGVPSPKIWKEYLQALNLNNIGFISHKDKSTGWRSYSFSIKNTNGNLLFSERASENKYLMAFVRNLIIRPSCFSCPSKLSYTKADITIADYWGIENLVPQMDDNKGTSFICCNTRKGKKLVEEANFKLIQADFQKSVPYNPCIVKSTEEPVERQLFLNNYEKNGINALFSLKKQKQNILKRMIKRILR